MINTINDLMSAIRRVKDHSNDKALIQVLVRQGTTLYNLSDVRLIFGHPEKKPNVSVPTCALIAEPTFNGDVMTITHVIAAVDSIKDQSENKGNTHVVVKYGDFILDVGKVEIVLLPSPIPDENHFPVCTVTVAD